MKTTVSTTGTDILINGKKTYADVKGTDPSIRGLLFNARFIQGIFDDKADPRRFARFGFDAWDADAQTDRLIEALPDWYSYGLRAFTVGIQGGGPCFTIDSATVDNNPFGTDGKRFDPTYQKRLDRLIKAADELGMVVIVSYFYGAQTARLEDGAAVRNAIKQASGFLKEGGYTNVIIEVANEYDIGPFKEHHPIIAEPEGMAMLIDLARDASGGLPTGCSGRGGSVHREIAGASDIVLIHGNGQTRQQYYNLIERAKSYAPGRPVVCNEDSQAISRLVVAERSHTSWGYYNNMTKQEPPTRFEILPGEDEFFALRMAEVIGIEKEVPDFEDRYYLHGLEAEMSYNGQRWIRLGSLYPESIYLVEFHRNGKLYYTAYDEPFSVHFVSTWRQEGVAFDGGGEEWVAKIYLRNGDLLEKHASV
jgi:hypothetical protein